MRNQIALVMTLFCVNVLQAQENNKKLIVHAEYGFSGTNYFILKDDYWFEHVPNFTVPADSLGFQRRNGSNNGIFVNSIAQISLEKEIVKPFLSSKNITSTIGVVLGTGANNHSGLTFYKNTEGNVDTLTSSLNGFQYFVSESRSESQSAYYFSNSAFFALRSMNRTNINRRLSFGLGFDLGYGFSFNDRMFSEKVVSVYSSSAYSGTSNTEISTTDFKGPFTQNFLFNFPIELAVRLQKKPERFLTNSAISINFLPSLNWTFVAKSQSFKGILSYAIGFRQVF